MSDRSEDRNPRPLPRDWLPDPSPPEGAPVWNTRVERILGAADPDLRRLRNRRCAVGATRWSATDIMGLWWKLAAALAAATAVLLLLTARPAAFPEPPQSSLSLSLMAVEGDPVALWEGFGIQADPVLALIAFQGQGDGTGQGMPLTSPKREDR